MLDEYKTIVISNSIQQFILYKPSLIHNHKLKSMQLQGNANFVKLMSQQELIKKEGLSCSHVVESYLTLFFGLQTSLLQVHLHSFIAEIYQKLLVDPAICYLDQPLRTTRLIQKLFGVDGDLGVSAILRDIFDCLHTGAIGKVGHCGDLLIAHEFAELYLDRIDLVVLQELQLLAIGIAGRALEVMAMLLTLSKSDAIVQLQIIGNVEQVNLFLRFQLFIFASGQMKRKTVAFTHSLSLRIFVFIDRLRNLFEFFLLSIFSFPEGHFHIDEVINLLYLFHLRLLPSWIQGQVSQCFIDQLEDLLAFSLEDLVLVLLSPRLMLSKLVYCIAVIFQCFQTLL